MKQRSVLFGGMVVLAWLALFASPSHPMVFMVGGPGGTAEEPNLDCEDPPDGDSDGAGGEQEACSSMEDWNPTIHCPVATGDNVHDLLDCLLDQIINPPPPCPPSTPVQPEPVNGDDVNHPQNLAENPPHSGGEECVDPMDREDFTVTLLPPPHFGLEILKLDGGEIERFSFRENFPGLQTVDIQILLRDRVARIGEIAERPSGTGSVFLTVNGRTIRMDTNRFRSSVELTAEMMRKLRAEGFTVDYHDAYLFVLADKGDPTGIHQVQFRSTDPAITQSDVSLLPHDAPELLSLGGSR